MDAITHASFRISCRLESAWPKNLFKLLRPGQFLLGLATKTRPAHRIVGMLWDGPRALGCAGTAFRLSCLMTDLQCRRAASRRKRSNRAERRSSQQVCKASFLQEAKGAKENGNSQKQRCSPGGHQRICSAAVAVA